MRNCWCPFGCALIAFTELGCGTGVLVGGGAFTVTVTDVCTWVLKQYAMRVYVVVEVGETVTSFGVETPLVPCGVFKTTEVALVTMPHRKTLDCPGAMVLGFAVKPLKFGLPLQPPFTFTVTATDAWLLPQYATRRYVVVTFGLTLREPGEATPSLRSGNCKKTALAFCTKPQFNEVS